MGANEQSTENEIKVFISHRDSKCDECGEELGSQAWITLGREQGRVVFGLRGPR